jgi:hypothetical protein
MCRRKQDLELRQKADEVKVGLARRVRTGHSRSAASPSAQNDDKKYDIIQA